MSERTTYVPGQGCNPDHATQSRDQELNGVTFSVYLMHLNANLTELIKMSASVAFAVSDVSICEYTRIPQVTSIILP